MQIAVLTFDGFNEIDSFVVSNILNRLRPQGWQAWITAPGVRVASKNDAVVLGSGIRTDEIARDSAMLARIRLDPERQLIASQYSGAPFLAPRARLAS